MDLKKEINKTRKLLNKEIIKADLISEDLIRKSKELDSLIVDYYNAHLVLDE